MSLLAEGRRNLSDMVSLAGGDRRMRAVGAEISGM